MEYPRVPHPGTVEVIGLYVLGCNGLIVQATQIALVYVLVLTAQTFHHVGMDLLSALPQPNAREHSA